MKRFLMPFIIAFAGCSSADDQPTTPMRPASASTLVHECAYTAADGTPATLPVRGDIATADAADLCNARISELKIGSNCRDCALATGSPPTMASEAWICECTARAFSYGRETNYGTFMAWNVHAAASLCWRRAEEKLEARGLIPRCRYMAECIRVGDPFRQRKESPGNCPDSP